MSQKPEDIAALLHASNLYETLFDVTRIVDPALGKVLEVSGGQICETQADCVSIFGATERCKNCSSVRALYSNEQVVKFEYVNDSVLLIISSPVTMHGRRFVVELAKDITHSMMVDSKDAHDADEVARIIGRLNKMATTDALTGLMNRRFVDEKLPNLIATGCAMNTPVSVALLDIDNFKVVNDTHGHHAGDAILCALSNLISACVRRESDFSARFGGEEFVLCFPGMNAPVCRNQMELLRVRIKEYPFSFNGVSIPLTVSIGVADSLEEGACAQDGLLALADRRMYQAKLAGRDKVF